MNLFELQFDGGLLRRGFWVYLWRIQTQDQRTMYYVGRTGDSSSANASSPFHRMSSHFGTNRKANALLRNLEAAGVDIFNSQFRLLALGPVYQEQSDFEAHKPLRDRTATIEAIVAERLRNNGFEVLGTHPGTRVTEEDVQEAADRLAAAALGADRDCS